MLNEIGWRLAMGLWASALMAGCGGSGSTPDAGDTGTADAGTPCCTEGVVPDGPGFLLDTSAFVFEGSLGTLALSSVTAADPGASITPPLSPMENYAACVDGYAYGGTCSYRSVWALTDMDTKNLQIDSSLAVDDLSWLVGQTFHVASADAIALVMYDDMDRLVVWQYHGPERHEDTTFEPPELPAALPFSISVRVAPEDALCRAWVYPCWLSEIDALDVTVDGVVHSLAQGESFEFVASGLRYRVTNRLLSSGSALWTSSCADIPRRAWSFDVVALGPAP